VFPKSKRLKKKKDFDKVFHEGASFKEDFLFLKIFKNNLEINRFGVAVGKKTFNKAVERNRIKRRVNELLRSELPELKKGWDIIVIVSGDIKNESPGELKGKINKLFEKAKLILD